MKFPLLVDLSTAINLNFQMAFMSGIFTVNHHVGELFSEN